MDSKFSEVFEKFMLICYLNVMLILFFFMTRQCALLINSPEK